MIWGEFMETNWIKTGWASTSITPSAPVFNAGQIYERVSKYVHDPITATCLVIENKEEQAILISCDMVSVPVKVLDMVKERLGGREDLDKDKIILCVTHTHNSSTFDGTRDFFSREEVLGRDIMPPQDVPADIFTGNKASEFLADKLWEIIVKAWEKREEGYISYASDYACVGFNRRPVFGEGKMEKSIMYGVCYEDDFKRFEGGSDQSIQMLFTWNLKGDLTGIAINLCCPSQVYELHSFVSADFWTFARETLKERFGQIGILPLLGAAGDQTPIDLVRWGKTNKETFKAHGAQAGEVYRNFDMTLLCQDIGMRIADACSRGFKKAGVHLDSNPVFIHKVIPVALPIRKVSYDDYVVAVKYLGEMKLRFSKEKPMKGADLVQAFEPLGVMKRWEQQNITEEFNFKVNIIRLGDASFATNPFELFCEYGLRIKARSDSEHTFVIQLANDNGGYLPTFAALAGGSYSSKPASTTCGPEGGDMLVDITVDEINKLWR